MKASRPAQVAVHVMTWILLACSVEWARADTIVLIALDSGQYVFNPFIGASHDPSNTNYLSGKSGEPESRNFFVFDLSGVVGQITGAELRLFNPAAGFSSTAGPTETYTVFNVSTPISTLRAGGTGIELVPVFDDLGSGVSYGSRVMSATDNAALVHINLNSAALDDLSSATGQFALGGAVTSLSPGFTVQFVFGFTGSPTDTRQLILTTAEPVPEPGSFFLFGLGIAVALAPRAFRVRVWQITSGGRRRPPER